MTKLTLKFKGGPGSGFHGHGGRKGQVGGSSSSGGGGVGGGGRESKLHGSNASEKARNEANRLTALMDREYTFSSRQLGDINVPKHDVEKAKKLNRIAVANQDAPNLEAYYNVKRDKDGTLYAVTDITPDATWVKSGTAKLAYDNDYFWLPDAGAYVYIGHLLQQ